MENTPTQSTQHAKLMQKMANVIKATGNVEKKGQNKEQGYKFATHSDIIEELRKHIADQKLFILPKPEGHTSSEIRSGSGKAGTLITMTIDFEIIDTETGYSVIVRWFGQGMDYGDKAMYKSYTGALKYFLLDTFMISTGDDPEKDSPDNAAHANPRPATRPAPQFKPMTGAQMDAIVDLCGQKGKNESDLQKFASMAFQIKDWKKADMAQANTIIKKLEAMSDYIAADEQTDEIAAGIEAAKERNDAKPGAQSAETIQ